MRPDEKKVYQNILDGFEENYYKVVSEAKLTDDASQRVKFYEECLLLVRDGPRLKSRTVQYNLVRHYQWKLRATLKLIENQTKSDGGDPPCTR